MASPIYISIDGNIGSGKSTRYEELKEYFKNDSDIGFLPEPVNEWVDIKDREGVNIIENLYKDTKKYAFRFQMMAYISRLALFRKEVRENKYKIIISERSTYTDKNIFAKMLYDDGDIEHDEYIIYNKWFDEFLDEMKLSGIIYIRAEPQTSYDRVVKRARQGETIPIEYLVKCHNYHEQWINTINDNNDNNTKIKVLTIDCDHDTDNPEFNGKNIEWLTMMSEWIKKFN
jgi:deoxyadenosine/deoxycytidine kinase